MFLKDVFVNSELKKQFVNLIDSHRLSHALLLLGKSGSHSFALSVALAQYLCCENPHDGDSCGVCNSCRMFENLQHPDLHLIFPNCGTKTVKANECESRKFMNEFRTFVFDHHYHLDYNEWVRRMNSENKQLAINIRDCGYIVSQNSTRAYSNGYKIYIIWKAEQMNNDAANKLLKTLEEPENKTLFLLLAEESDRILPTILSRTQLVKIPQLTEEVIRQHLIEDEQLSDKEAADIAAISEGSYVKARALIQENSELHHFLTLYNILLRSVTNFIKNPNDLARIDYMNVQKNFDGLVKEGREAQKNFLNYLFRLFWNELLLSQKGGALVKATSEEYQVLSEYKDFFTLKNATPLQKACNTAIYHISRNVNSNLVFTDFYFQLRNILSTK